MSRVDAVAGACIFSGVQKEETAHTGPQPKDRRKSVGTRALEATEPASRDSQKTPTLMMIIFSHYSTARFLDTRVFVTLLPHALRFPALIDFVLERQTKNSG